jgi:hypothetical protein
MYLSTNSSKSRDSMFIPSLTLSTCTHHQMCAISQEHAHFILWQMQRTAKKPIRGYTDAVLILLQDTYLIPCHKRVRASRHAYSPSGIVTQWSLWIPHCTAQRCFHMFHNPMILLITYQESCSQQNRVTCLYRSETDLLELLWSDMVDHADRVWIARSVIEEWFHKNAALGNHGSHGPKNSVQRHFLLARELFFGKLVPCLVKELRGFCWDPCQWRLLEPLQQGYVARYWTIRCARVILNDQGSLLCIL